MDQWINRCIAVDGWIDRCEWGDEMIYMYHTYTVFECRKSKCPADLISPTKNSSCLNKYSIMKMIHLYNN